MSRNQQGKANVGVIVGIVIVGLIAWAIVANGVLGMERATYSLIMRWVNFGILVLVAVKYGRGPILNFLKNQRDEIANALHELEETKKLTENKIAESQEMLEAGQDKLEQIKQRILTEGERRKEQLVADAKQESIIMLESAKLKIDAQMREARDRIRAELIDLASELATEKLPQLLTPKDQEQLVDSWMQAAKA